MQGLEISPAGPVVVVVVVVPLTSAKSHFDNQIEHTETAVEVCVRIYVYFAAVLLKPMMVKCLFVE